MVNLFEEPYAVILHARFCEGGWSNLPSTRPTQEINRSMNEQTGRDRRKFLKLAVGTAGAAIAAGIIQCNSTSLKKEVKGIAKKPGLPQAGIENTLLRMQQDLKRVLSKPVSERDWVMVIDPRRCIGCKSCVVSCKAEHVTPPGVSYRTVLEIETGSYPDVKCIFVPTNCMQCDNPPCMKAAPAGAIYKRPDGIVAIDYTRFTSRKGFETAQHACPYTALYFDEGNFYTSKTPGSIQPYETRTFCEYEEKYTRVGDRIPAGCGRKCHFCLHRLNAGMLPSCVTTCIGGAMYFGSKNDPQSLVSGLLAKRKVIRIKEDAGTQPRVYYIEDEIPNVRQIACKVCHPKGAQ